MNGAMMKATSRFAMAAAAGFVMSLGSAKAADLGGNCCADLEERVAELEATTLRKGNRKVSVTLSGQINRAIAYWDDSVQSKAYSIDSGVSRSAFQFDGSARITPDVVAGFQFVWVLGLGARGHHVSQIDDDGNQASFAGVSADGDAVPQIEIANWYLESKTYGKLTVGRINTAQTATTQVDLAGFLVVGGPQFGLWNNSYYLRNPNGVLTANGVGVAPSNVPAGFNWVTLYGGNDVSIAGTSRADGARYDTPTVGGFIGSIAWAESDFWDAALRYAGEHHGFRFAAAVSYSVNKDTEPDAVGVLPIAGFPLTDAAPDIRKWQGSASLLHLSTGLFLNGAFVNKEYAGGSAGELVGGLIARGNRPDTKFWYVASGVAKNYFGPGNTVVYGEYGKIEDGATGAILGPTSGFTQTGGCAAVPTGACFVTASEASYWGIGVVQFIDAAALELYLSYRNYSVDELRVTTDGGATSSNAAGGDFQMIMSGGRIRF